VVTLLDDPAHLVKLRVPSGFTVVQPFDGTSARWGRDDVTLTYQVDAGAGVPAAVANHDQVAGQLATSTYDATDPATQPDGKYVVSGFLPSGSAVYERGRVRCGDLVRYRLEWVSPASQPVASATANTLFNRNTALDSMGGNYATCG